MPRVGHEIASDNVLDVVENHQIAFKPFPKQEIFLSSEVDEVLFGGARGGGKTAALIIDAALKVRKWHYEGSDPFNLIPVVDKYSIDYPEYRAIIFRREFTDIYLNFQPEAEKIYSKLGAVWREKRQCFIFPSGAKIHLAYCDNPDTLKKYIGGNYHYLGIEEVNQFPMGWIRDLGASIRSTNPELKPYKRYTTNPGGVGHVWLRRFFIDVCPPVRGPLVMNETYHLEYHELYPGAPYTDEEGNTRQFIPSLVFDNPKLVDNDPSYVRYLNGLDNTKREMWLLGNWDVMGGVFFEEFSKFHHVIQDRDFVLNTEVGRIYRLVDYGTAKPFVCLFMYVDPDGYCTIFDEIYETGLPPSEQAKRIRSVTSRWGLEEEDVYQTIVDPAMKIRAHEYMTTLHSTLDIYESQGIEHIALGNNDRVPGWAVVREFLKVPDEGRPYLVFCERCKNSIETIPSLVKSNKNPEDLNTDGDDHCVTGDTLIATVTGDVPIKDLIGKSGYCYGWNNAEKRMGVTEFYNPRLTRKNAEIYQLTLDNGQTLRATPDHLIMMRNGSYRELRDLKPGDSLMPLYRHIHRVVSVEPCGREDTYCLTTRFGNFATDSIVVHNCADALRYGLMFIDKPYLRVKYHEMKEWQKKLKTSSNEDGRPREITSRNVWCG